MPWYQVAVSSAKFNATHSTANTELFENRNLWLFMYIFFILSESPVPKTAIVMKYARSLFIKNWVEKNKLQQINVNKLFSKKRVSLRHSTLISSPKKNKIKRFGVEHKCARFATLIHLLFSKSALRPSPFRNTNVRTKRF